MSSRTGLRGRRTRVYDCNYNMGEQYYKPVLDRMDRKVGGKSDIEERIEARARACLEGSEANNLRQEASSMLEDSLFDSRGARAARGRPLSAAIEDEDFDDEITSSLKRLRASKKTSSFAEDVDLDSAISNLENRSRLGISEKILDSVGIGKSDISAARRALMENEERTEKRISRRLKQEDEGNLTRWTAVKSADSEASAAALRAKASRARLSDLEDEMNEMSARQAAREQRAANLRALVAENESEAISSSKISIRTEKKQVSF